MSWEEVKLEDIFEIARGGSPRPIDKYITTAPNGVNWISIKDASNSSKYIFETEKKIIPEGVKKSRLVKPDDFLLTNSMSFGRPYILKTTGCIHDGWLVLSGNKEKVNLDYFYHLLSSDFIYRKFSGLAAGAVVKNLNTDLVRGVTVPLPPLPEQRRIAAILDKADELRQKRRQAIEKLDQLLQATFIDMFGDPVSNPKGWEVVPLKNIGDIHTGNTPPRDVPENYGDAIEWIKSDNLNNDEDYATQANEYLSLQGAKKGRIVKSGSILVTCIAGSFNCIGNLAIVDRDVAFNQQINAIVPYLNIQTEFLYYLMKMSKSIIQSASTNSMKGMINKSKFGEIVLPIAPLELQKEFSTIFFLFSKIKEDMKSMQTNQESLFASLQQRAFSGNL